MPTIVLSAVHLGPLPLVLPHGGRFQAPRLRFHCLLRLPEHLLPRDGIVDTGAPLSCFPLSIWTSFRFGTDFEWLPFEAGFTPPTGQMIGWRYTFRIARFLVPLSLMDYATEVDRHNVIAAFADTDPPAPAARLALPPIIIGLWGGLLEGGKLAVSRTAAGQVAGELDLP
ncbi:MAG TPA: hypothetical protein VLM40_16500 [Gemmata sp.]|nr:hypothetical protein [Gemmata sp.]